MQVLEPKISLGLHSDLSAVYFDACLLKTDGLDILDRPVSITRPYPAELRETILSMHYPDDFTDAKRLSDLNARLTLEHTLVAQELMEQVARQVPKIDIIGYSGHLVHLDARDRNAVILGDGDRLAHQLQIPVVDRFIQTDLQAGGVGEPILPTFWEAITRPFEKPLGIINLNGISRLIYIGPLGEQRAFDVGVGCLLLDRWVQRRAGTEMDFDGLLAEKGTPDDRLLSYLLKDEYLHRLPPKSLDRDDMDHLLTHVEGCSAADGAATLTEFIIGSIVAALPFLPDRPKNWILTGGGTLNPSLVLRLKRALDGQVRTISDLDMPHYNLDAAGYAFLAVRSLMQLPISFPDTTGVLTPLSGGLYHRASE